MTKEEEEDMCGGKEEEEEEKDLSLFKHDCQLFRDCIMLDHHHSTASVRQVFEDDMDRTFSALPPLNEANNNNNNNKKQRKRPPLCTFLNFRGTRLPRDDLLEVSSLPSLEDEDHPRIVSFPELLEPVAKRARKMLNLQTDPVMKALQDKLDRLLEEARKTRLAMDQYERSNNNKRDCKKQQG